MDENKADLSTLSHGVATGGPPPVGIATTERQVIFNDIGMRIDREGVWHYRGSPINRIELVKLFSTVLRIDEAGGHWLITPVEVAPVAVEDAPFMAVEMMATGEGEAQTVSFRTNIDTSVTVDADHPLQMAPDPETGDMAPYVTLDRGLRAKLNRATYYDVVSIAVEEKAEQAQIIGIWSAGRLFELGAAETANGSA